MDYGFCWLFCQWLSTLFLFLLVGSHCSGLLFHWPSKKVHSIGSVSVSRYALFNFYHLTIHFVCIDFFSSRGGTLRDASWTIICPWIIQANRRIVLNWIVISPCVNLFLQLLNVGDCPILGKSAVFVLSIPFLHGSLFSLVGSTSTWTSMCVGEFCLFCCSYLCSATGRAKASGGQLGSLVCSRLLQC